MSVCWLYGWSVYYNRQGKYSKMISHHITKTRLPGDWRIRSQQSTAACIFNVAHLAKDSSDCSERRRENCINGMMDILLIRSWVSNICRTILAPRNHQTISSTLKQVVQQQEAFVFFTSHWMNPMNATQAYILSSCDVFVHCICNKNYL